MDLNLILLIAILIVGLLTLLFKGSSAPPVDLAAHRKLDLILKHLGIDPYEGLDARLFDLVRSGQKIEAIRLYRLQTGVGLKEAKDHVDSL